MQIRTLIMIASPIKRHAIALPSGGMSYGYGFICKYFKMFRFMMFMYCAYIFKQQGWSSLHFCNLNFKNWIFLKHYCLKYHCYTIFIEQFIVWTSTLNNNWSASTSNNKSFVNYVPKAHANTMRLSSFSCSQHYNFIMNTWQ